MGRQRKQTVPQVMLSLDFGGSGLKGIAQTLKENSQVLYMEPEVFPATLESLKDKTDSNLSHAYPENLAWVGVGNEYRAVGYLATSRYHANAGLSKKKYSQAVYRTLAALWVVQQKLALPPQFEVMVAALLPPGEFEDSKLLLEMLREALAAFETPTGTMTVRLSQFQCYPEGAGVYLLYSRTVGEAIKRTVCAVVMVGYRNASVLVSRRGVVDRGRTIDLGMVRLVELVQQRTSGLKSEPLLKAIALAGEQPQAKHFLGLTEPGTSPEVRREEAEKIVEAVISARREYVTVLTIWLSEVLPIPSLDEVVLAGGTADYVRTELDKHFPAIPVKWHGGFKMPASFNEQWLGNRLADVYGLSLVLAEGVLGQAKGEVSVYV